jgi:hypothetical protein
MWRIAMKYKLRPSGSARWLACPASLVLEAGVEPEKRDDQHAAYLGSATHELLEMCIKQQKRAEAFRGEFITVYDEEYQNFPYVKEVDETMIASANFFIDEVGEPLPGSEVYSELQMEHSEIPELRGTADYICINGDHALLADLKNGTGIVQVQKRDGTINTQLLSYASMIFDKFEQVETITLAIIQPNGKTKKKVRSTGINRKDCEIYLDRVKEAAKLADEATEANLNVIASEGSHCWFCKAKDICPARGKAEIDRDFGGDANQVK